MSDSPSAAEEIINAVQGLQGGEFDSRPGPSLQWYPQQWLADDAVLLMSWAARGMHFHLLQIAWRQSPPCSIPDDELSLRGWCNHPDGWPDLWKQISRGWRFKDGRWWNLGLCRSYLHQMEVRTQRSAASNKRWTKTHANASDKNAIAPSHTSKSIDPASPPECTSSSTSSSSSTTSSTEDRTTEGSAVPVQEEAPPAAGAAPPKETDSKSAKNRARMEAAFAKLELTIPEIRERWKDRLANCSGAKRPTLGAQASQLESMVEGLNLGWPLEHILAALKRATDNGYSGLTLDPPRQPWGINGNGRRTGHYDTDITQVGRNEALRDEIAAEFDVWEAEQERRHQERLAERARLKAQGGATA